MNISVDNIIATLDRAQQLNLFISFINIKKIVINIIPTIEFSTMTFLLGNILLFVLILAAPIIDRCEAYTVK